MLLRTILILSGTVAAAACVPGSPIYLGAGFATIHGTLFALEDMSPIPGAEVCMFGADTTCVRTELDGTYKAFVTDSTINISFRLPRARPAVIEGVQVYFDETYEINCVMSTRLTLSTDPGSCREEMRPARNR